MCISWTNKEFEIIKTRCNHEDCSDVFRDRLLQKAYFSARMVLMKVKK
jgi:hypothetical protein